MRIERNIGQNARLLKLQIQTDARGKAQRRRAFLDGGDLDEISVGDDTPLKLMRLCIIGRRGDWIVINNE